MKFRLLCKRTAVRFARHPFPFTALYALWFLLRFFTLYSSPERADLTAADGSALTGCLTVLSLQCALFFQQDRDGAVLYRLKAAGAGGPVLFGAFQTAWLLAGIAASALFCVFLRLTGLPFRSSLLLLPAASVLPALFYSSLGILCGIGLSRNGIWILCFLWITLSAAFGSALLLDWASLAPGLPAPLYYLPVNVYTRFFMAVFSADFSGGPGTILLPLCYSLAAAVCAFLAWLRCLEALKQKDL